MQHVFTYSMAPMHWAPYRTVRVILIKHMVFSIEVHQAIGIIHPSGWWCEMKLWPVGLVDSLQDFWGRVTTAEE